MLETILPMLKSILGLPTVLLLILLVIVAVVAFKFFQYLLKIVLTGTAFGAFPLVTNFLGIPILPLTLESILSCALLGIVLCLIYSSISFAFKIVKIVLWPFRKMFGGKSKEKVVIQQVREKKEKEED